MCGHGAGELALAVLASEGPKIANELRIAERKDEGLWRDRCSKAATRPRTSRLPHVFQANGLLASPDEDGVAREHLWREGTRLLALPVLEDYLGKANISNSQAPRPL